MQIATTASIRRLSPIATLAISTEWSPKTLEPGAIARSEVKFLAFFTLALCLVTTLPYAAGHLVSVPGTVFTDVLEHGIDSNNYLAYAQQARREPWAQGPSAWGAGVAALFCKNG